MQALTGTGADTAGSTQAFKTIKDGKVWVHVESTWNGGYVNMMKSKDGITYSSFYPDSTLERAGPTNEQTKLYDLPGGWWWRWTNDGTSTSTTAWVDGNHIKLV